MDANRYLQVGGGGGGEVGEVFNTLSVIFNLLI